ncbi:hypothetical protein A2363_02065 [Candidatus Gottesmanbacteria bacterium RIFOXYB1_FULL_47_11]|uniref:Polymerase nucleotidyl transferase domain-containing protein n=1 Tax=Candidatus Gottesmanbacteria bacterium RIFOXYB1_FULL_47_11 TaxID=1798401 RepID=A0A1F6BDG9_9BACT|nr:MAG: hypothetical protein A2363_02065 [Candidatus Gottesmanbacteria bacterium RIFOXYB1_FULL_47_11]
MDDAAIATIAYADVFDYPLRRDELVRWMMFDGKVPKQEKRFYYLPGRTHLIAIRRKRAKWQQEKWSIAERVARILSIIPTLQLIGVTGGLAMDNAGQQDDVDLFFIVSDGTLWVSRLLATVLIELLGIRRRPNDTSVANKVCLNMFMTECGLAISMGERDCFSAHEVLQMRPLWERGNIYKRFLKANGWVKMYLPNAWKERGNSKWLPVHRKDQSNILFSILEPFAKKAQLWYMKKHRTNEVISDTTLRFHPNDARLWIKRKLAARLARYHIPLDKIFYAS